MRDNNKFGVLNKEWIAKLASLSKEDGDALLERFRFRLHQQQSRILSQASRKKIISKEGYEKKYKHMFYEEFGFDVFLQYLDGVMNADADYFVTFNKNLIKNKEELERKFGLKIITPEELAGIQHNQNNNL